MKGLPPSRHAGCLPFSAAVPVPYGAVRAAGISEGNHCLVTLEGLGGGGTQKGPSLSKPERGRWLVCLGLSLLPTIGQAGWGPPKTPLEPPWAILVLQLSLQLYRCHAHEATQSSLLEASVKGNDNHHSSEGPTALTELFGEAWIASPTLYYQA